MTQNPVNSRVKTDFIAMILINKTTFIFIILFLPLTLTSSESFDLGDPTIQAVCKITIMSGETFEGYITLGHGGYYGIWPNGFCFEDSDGFKPFLLSLDFQSIQRVEHDNFKVNLRKSGITFNNITHLHFIEREYSTPITNLQTIIINENNTSSWNNSEISKIYNLKESVELYQSLPESTYLTLDSKEKIEVIKIKLSEIKQLEFVENPSNKWVEEIKKKTDQANQIYNGPDSSGDFMPAFWYHEIVANEIKYDYYEPRIKGTINK